MSAKKSRKNSAKSSTPVDNSPVKSDNKNKPINKNNQAVPTPEPVAPPVAPASAPENEVPETSGLGCLARMYWMMWGNFGVIVSALLVARQGNRLGTADLFYWLFAVSLPAVRYIDMKHSIAQEHKEPAKELRGWRRYAIFILLASVVLWLGAHWAGGMMPGAK